LKPKGIFDIDRTSEANSLEFVNYNNNFSNLNPTDGTEFRSNGSQIMEDKREYMELANNYQKLFSENKKKDKMVERYNMQSIIR